MTINPTKSYYEEPSTLTINILNQMGCYKVASTCIESIRYMQNNYGWKWELLSATKYLWRAGQKEDQLTSDIEKAIRYLEWEHELRGSLVLPNIAHVISQVKALLPLTKSMEPINSAAIKVALLARNSEMPEYAKQGDSGADLCASEQLEIGPGEWELVPTGVVIALPPGKEGQIRSRSGLALKKGIVVFNSPGTIDSNYRGEIGIILINHSKEVFEVNIGDRIAQLVIVDVNNNVDFLQVSFIDTETDRGSDGFGSTGR